MIFLCLKMLRKFPGKLFILMLMALSAALLLVPQQAEKEQELEALRREIAELQTQIREHSRDEKELASLINKYDRRNFLLNKLLSGIRKEENDTRFRITAVSFQIDSLTNARKQLQDTYAKYVVAVYKQRLDSYWLYLLSSESLEQALLRYRYLSAFTKKGREDVSKLKETASLLTSRKNELNSAYQKNHQLRIEKEQEEKNLAVLIDDKEEALNQVRKDKATTESILKAKKKAEGQIVNLIANLVAEEEQKARVAEERRKAKEAEERRRAKESEAKRKKESEKKDEAISKNESGNPVTEPELTENRGEEKEKVTTRKNKPPVSEDDFSVNEERRERTIGTLTPLPGKINIPLRSGKIIRRYGEVKSSESGTVLPNFGVDIRSDKGGAVAVAGDGVVSAIEWLPGYGTVVIVTHKNGYRTVYGRLSTIAFSEGALVKEGDTLGMVANSIEGFVLHFEIWKDRQSADPEKRFR